MQPRQGLRPLRRDLLDVDAALGREHEERLLRAAVEGEGEVVLLRDVGRLLDPELAHDVAADVEAENLPGMFLGLLRPVGELDPARLAAPAGQHLRLDDDLARRAPRPPRGPPRAWSRARPSDTGMPKRAEQLLALVLVEVHDRGASLSTRSAGHRFAPTRVEPVTRRPGRCDELTPCDAL